MRGTFTFRDDSVYKMPPHFGGDPFYPFRSVYGDVTGLSFQYETDPAALVRLIPTDFELLEPLVNVQFANCREVDWMAGGEYRLIQVAVPVQYLGNDEGLTGQYVLVIWENKTCPILGGREEDGMPKIFADIACERHFEGRWFTAASYEQLTFLQLEINQKNEWSAEQITSQNEHPKINFFGWRCLPNLGRGGVTLSHATLYPQEMKIKQAWSGEGKIQWTELAPGQHTLQWRIIKALSELPIVQYTQVMMVKSENRLNVGDSRILP